MSEHLHSLRKVLGKLYCTGPQCFKKFSLLEVDGKLVKCPKCKSEFIFQYSKYPTNAIQLTCNKCDSLGPWELTLETQKALLAEVIVSRFVADLESRKTLLQQRFNRLEKMEEALSQRRVDLDIKEAALAILQKRTREQRSKLASHFKWERLKAKAQKVEKLKQKTVVVTPGNSDAGDLVLSAIADMFKEQK